MGVTVGLETIATLLTIVAGVVGLGATVIASNGRTRAELKAEMTELRTEFKNDMVELRTELKSDIAELRNELRNDIAESRAEIRGDLTRLDDRVYALAAGLAPRLVPTPDDETS